MFRDFKQAFGDIKPFLPEHRFCNDVIAKYTAAEVVDKRGEVDRLIDGTEKFLHGGNHTRMAPVALLEYIEITGGVRHGG